MAWIAGDTGYYGVPKRSPASNALAKRLKEHEEYFGSKQAYAEAIKQKEARGETLSDPAAAAAFKAANPELFREPSTPTKLDFGPAVNQQVRQAMAKQGVSMVPTKTSLAETGAHPGAFGAPKIKTEPAQSIGQQAIKALGRFVSGALARAGETSGETVPYTGTALAAPAGGAPVAGPPAGLVPVRSTAEGMGATVHWDAATNTVTANGQRVPVTYVNGVAYAPPSAIQGAILSGKYAEAGGETAGLPTEAGPIGPQPGRTAGLTQPVTTPPAGAGAGAKPGAKTEAAQQPPSEPKPSEPTGAGVANLNERGPAGGTGQIDAKALLEQANATVTEMLGMTNLGTSPGASPDVAGMGFLNASNFLAEIDRVRDQLVALAEREGREIDPYTISVLDQLKKTVEEQKGRLQEELNRRGLYHSGILLELESRADQGLISEQAKVLYQRGKEIRDRFNKLFDDLIMKRVELAGQFGLEAMRQEGQTRRELEQTRRSLVEAAMRAADEAARRELDRQRYELDVRKQEFEQTEKWPTEQAYKKALTARYMRPPTEPKENRADVIARNKSGLTYDLAKKPLDDLWASIQAQYGRAPTQEEAKKALTKIEESVMARTPEMLDMGLTRRDIDDIIDYAYRVAGVIRPKQQQESYFGYFTPTP